LFKTDEFPVTIHPMDDYNRALLRNVRPPAWRNPEPSGRYNLVVIGSGTAGLVGSIGGAGLGARVALIEKHILGGDCLNWGCVPSKSVIRPARIMADLRRGSEMGIQIPDGVEADFGQVMARMRQIRAGISHDDSAERLQREGVELFLGAARFIGPETVEVVDGDRRQTLHFARALIATGSKATVPPIDGIQEVGYLTNETLFQLTELPRRLAVIGGGPIGVEMAQAFARLGSRVTLLQKGAQLLPREDRDAACIVQEALARDGVELILSASVSAATCTEESKLIHYEQNGEQRTLAVDAILLSVGRSPAVKGLNLEAAGVEYSEKGVVVNDSLQTTNPNIYAAGDVAQPYQFTHVADATSRIVLQNALFPGPKKKLSDLVIPWCTFTDPEVAHVGMNEAEASARGIAVETLVHPLSHVDRSRTDGNTEGFVKIYVKQGSDKIVGATIVASEAGEMINVLTLAIKANIGLQTIATVIFPYPVQSEAIKKIADKHNRTRLTPLVRRLFHLWFRWRRKG
jgi:pyruvate/2-oxoglutarate dehydrogenase complex dihydrolipoamide dehydrogenase (E3) component